MKAEKTRSIQHWLKRKCAFLFASFLFSMPAMAGDISVSESVELDVKPAGLWAFIGDYNSLYRWHPNVKSSVLVGDGTRQGDMRLLILLDGTVIPNELVVMDNQNMSYTYKSLSSTMPITDYVGTVSVTENASGGSTLTWVSTFNANEGVKPEDAQKLVIDIYWAAYNYLKELFHKNN
ncbi:SRPBCC family protein [Parasalinivibrio latis]|uniref:SRPBCC family protein n=1 Tax=Parasalinivibrio latis TaxID=2952610 RepID=UPI0030E5AE0F